MVVALAVPVATKSRILVVFDHFGIPKTSKLAKIRVVLPILRIPESPKLQIFLIFDFFHQKPPKGCFLRICGLRKTQNRRFS